MTVLLALILAAQRFLEQPGDAIRRVPAEAIETLVQGALTRLAGKSLAEVADLVARVEVHVSTVQMLIRRSACFKRASDPQTELEVLAQRLSPGERITRDVDDEAQVRVGAVRLSLKR